jgi:arginyl-tRNA synthetase
MSKRAGTFITVRDVVDKVGTNVLRFVMLTRKPEQSLDFDLAKVLEQSKDNPVFYVQYAHARCFSLRRMTEETLPQALPLSRSPETGMLALLTHEAELGLIRRLCYWPRLVEAAAEAYEPHRIAFYLQELAAEFHAYWNLGTQDASLRCIQPENLPLTTARLALSRAVATVLASGLNVLGVEPVEEMR